MQSDYGNTFKQWPHAGHIQDLDTPSRPVHLTNDIMMSGMSINKATDFIDGPIAVSSDGYQLLSDEFARDHARVELADDSAVPEIASSREGITNEVVKYWNIAMLYLLSSSVRCCMKL